MPESASEVPGGRTISLGHLIALNDEMAALTRAGLPLERGLRDVGRDLSGGLSAAMLRLSARMDQGEGLSEALAADKEGFPPIYRAVVEAGIRAGRLPAALESLAGFVRSYHDARRTIGLAFWYPMVVLVLAYTLFVLMVTQMVPRFLAAFESLEITVPSSMKVLGAIGSTALYWGPILPLLLLFVAVWWAWTGRASSFPSSGSQSPLRWFPWMRAMIANAEAANFAQLLSILITHGVPYHQAVRLASEASGDSKLVVAGHEVAVAVERGDLHAVTGGARGIPPLLRWILISGQGQGRLADSLAQIATIYRKRALYQAEKLKVFLPTMMLLGIGLSATLLYALTFFIPMSELLRGLAVPVN
ncbi:type II secretion system F family protein [Singulisphaera acidiphila]|uniref:Type II secretory pathway, component PulF n=1 Tax=Singulisphaera acidiphila (strain ATCC BAA-1392 / DSM 18658 / VKM B-2454 / MOB10) TaxID=886293 RepID=L0DP65_SINAD|nr:type II secretion system F family protein [Singulisphaera acidiphila]AGA30461.1 type II secretory pathway, component PulF [Singulisphaera acidiphila DSM 18658]